MVPVLSCLWFRSPQVPPLFRLFRTPGRRRGRARSETRLICCRLRMSRIRYGRRPHDVLAPGTAANPSPAADGHPAEGRRRGTVPRGGTPVQSRTAGFDLDQVVRYGQCRDAQQRARRYRRDHRFRRCPGDPLQEQGHLVGCPVDDVDGQFRHVVEGATGRGVRPRSWRAARARPVSSTFRRRFDASRPWPARSRPCRRAAVPTRAAARRRSVVPAPYAGENATPSGSA